MSKKLYYAARTGDVGPIRIDLETLRGLFGSIYQRFALDGYFDEAFGIWCVDAGNVPGTAGSDIEGFFFLKLRKRDLWPIHKHHSNYSESDIFSIIELLYDLVSKPDKSTGRYHGFNDCGWHFQDFDKPTGQQEFRAAINEIISDYESGFTLSHDGQVISAKQCATASITSSRTEAGTSFDARFPYGIPIGLHGKPSGAVEDTAQGQTFSFHESDSVGILRGDVYPNFCMYDFEQWAQPKQRLGKYIAPAVPLQTPQGALQRNCLTTLINICQTPPEKQFLRAYLEMFVAPHLRPKESRAFPSIEFMSLKDTIPALLPQSWINWRSNDREALKRMGYKYANATMRFDFVAFWKSRNFLIQVDGIEHYAERVGDRWDANEERYAARLKEDRLLRMQGWNIFRIGNWETRDPARLKQVLEELRMFIGFEYALAPKEQDDYGSDDEIPF
ncbi:hypothetical protein [Sorangium sp. So ce1000]|uniref:hypothetical protein n=1 Tax=Sorangium sp. So ce1000 TaxID=3133325 RepID=UPI003F603A00